jgi:adenosylhomocysteinase
MDYKVRDISLAEQGERQLAWAELHMPALMEIGKELGKRKPLKGLRIAAVLHVTKETGILARTLKEAGATVYLAGSNPLSTQDDIAAALAKEGISVFAWRGQSNEDYYKNMESILSIKPDILMDDGADLHAAAHGKHKELKILGGTEETTTGVNRLKVLDKNGKLRYPVIAVNNAKTKYLFDNRYGTGQSTIDGILRATNILIAGKCAVVVGYGWVGRGIAMRLNGFGARVIVTEVDPFRALEATMDGFEVMTVEKAAGVGEIFVTATGNKGTITTAHIRKMKNGAILCNSGHFDVEIDVEGLERMAKAKKEIRKNTVEYKLDNGRSVYLLAEGRLVNLGAAEGHPSEVMDMSFCNQALAAVYIAENYKKLSPKVYDVFTELDEKVAKQKLSSMGIEIDKLTDEQKKYMNEWEVGT